MLVQKEDHGVSQLYDRHHGVIGQLVSDNMSFN